MSRMPLDLSVIVSNPDGSESETFTTDNHDANSRAVIGEFGDKRDVGFESSSFALPGRDPFTNYSSPRWLQDMKIVGADGSIANQCRISGVGAEGGRGIKVEGESWYAALKDTANVAEIFVDRDVSKWGGVPLNRQAIALTNNFTPSDGSVVAAAIQLRYPSPVWTNPGMPLIDSWYTAPPGVNLGSCDGDWTWTGLGASAQLTINMLLSTDDTAASIDDSGSLDSAGPAHVTLAATVSGRRFAVLTTQYAGANPTADSVERSVTWSNIAVYGDHGLTTITPSTIVGYLIDKYGGLITRTDDSIEDSSYEIGHLVADSGDLLTPILKANALVLNDIGVWDNRVLWMSSPPNLDDFDYELDRSKGATLIPDSGTISDDRPANGVWVYYTDVLTSRSERIGPYGTGARYDSAGSLSLVDTSEENPCNREGCDRHFRMDIGFPCTGSDAEAMGAIWLAENSLPSTAGQGTAEGYVTNRADVEVPAWMVRSGDRIKYKHETTIRRVYSKRYDPASHRLALAYDDAPRTLDALFERIGIKLTMLGSK